MRLRTRTLALLIALIGVSDGLCWGLIDPTHPNPFVLRRDSSLAVGTDGAFYVADGHRAIQAFDASGLFRFEIPNTSTDSWMEVDQAGKLFVVRNRGGRDGAILSTYSREGTLESERQIGSWASAIAIGPENVPYVAADSTVWRVPSTGEPIPYLFRRAELTRHAVPL